MRRPAKGATTHPTLTRPGMGYGRPLRPAPSSERPAVATAEVTAEVVAFLRGETIESRGDDRSSVTSLDSLA